MKKRLLLNAGASLLLYLITIICNFILPRLVLLQYGSAVNGLVNSCSQFLALITFLELGVGAVVSSALYKPLTDKDDNEVSAIITSGTRFFRRIAMFLLGYVILLMIVYPLLINKEFDWQYTASLIAAISISYFAQYYFGIIDNLLLTANQKGYIQQIAQITVLILSTVASVFLIKQGASIHVVRLVSSFIFMVKPLMIRLYINKNYRINRHFLYKEEPIKQKWNGIAQHISAIILSEADVIVLTFFSTLANVSIYTVYTLVLNGIKSLFTAAFSGVQSFIGALWARKDPERLKQVFESLVVCMHAVTVFLFSVTGRLIVPFIQVYTNGVSDANYLQPLFAFLITVAFAGQCFGLPYGILIRAAGHYKETQSVYVKSAFLNVIISVAVVWKYGLIGVAIGTIIAMFYQTVMLARYSYRKLIKISLAQMIMQVVFDALVVFLIVFATSWVELSTVSYYSWLIMAIQVAMIALVIVIGMLYLFYRKQLKFVLDEIIHK